MNPLWTSIHLTGLFGASWSKWSQITDPDLDNPKGMHPIAKCLGSWITDPDLDHPNINGTHPNISIQTWVLVLKYSIILIIHWINSFNLTEINDWQVVALVTPSRHPFKNVLDSRANNGTPKRSRYSDLSTRRQFKRKQRSKSLSTSLKSLHQLSSAIKSLQVPSPVHEEIKCSKKDVLSPTKLNQVSVEDFVEKVVGRILREVEKVWIQLQYLKNTAEVSLKWGIMMWFL